MEKPLEKVTAFVTRRTRNGTELLLFEHPFAGTQLPAGTVEEGESHLDAAIREAGEETGLSDLRVRQYIGSMDTCLPGDTHAVLRATKVYSRPNHDSFDWVEHHRVSDGFSQVTYEEGDRFPDPDYITYRITGWVPSEVLSRSQRRCLYHLTFGGDSPDEWTVSIDNHLFRLCWASLGSLPCMVAPQSEWLDYATGALGYSLE